MDEHGGFQRIPSLDSARKMDCPKFSSQVTQNSYWACNCERYDVLRQSMNNFCHVLAMRNRRRSFPFIYDIL